MKRGIIAYHEITYLGDYTNDKASNLWEKKNIYVESICNSFKLK